MKKTKMSRANQLRKNREKMWNENPHCYYCGIITVLPDPKDKGKHKPNTATIEHLYSKLNPKRKETKGQKQPIVLACSKCNMKKAQEDEIKFKTADN